MRERILTIRLMEKAGDNPALAEAFVIVAVEGYSDHERQGISKTEADTYRQ